MSHWQEMGVDSWVVEKEVGSLVVVMVESSLEGELDNLLLVEDSLEALLGVLRSYLVVVMGVSSLVVELVVSSSEVELVVLVVDNSEVELVVLVVDNSEVELVVMVEDSSEVELVELVVSNLVEELVVLHSCLEEVRGVLRSYWVVEMVVYSLVVLVVLHSYLVVGKVVGS